MPERRSAVMIAVEAWWEGEDGTLRTERARIVNKSISGACLQVKSQISVGAKLRIQSRWEEFCGVAKYCRIDGFGYLVGIQREKGKESIPKQAGADEPNRDGTRNSDVIGTKEVESRAQREELQLPEIAAPAPTLVRPAVARRNARPGATKASGATATRQASHRTVKHIRLGTAHYRGLDAPRLPVALAKIPARESETPNERDTSPMDRNWLGLGKRNNKAETANENGSGNGGDAKESADAGTPSTERVRQAPASEFDSGYEGALLTAEEIYLAAGIVNARKGYTINKIVEMLHSEHLATLPKEMRRAAVMMALDAAGITVDEVLRDAKARLEALNSYGAEQKALRETEWARKAEEHVQLQVELEQIRLRYMERMKQNVDSVTRDRARFDRWLAMKREQAQSITEAAELCLKEIPPEAANDAPATVKAKEPGLKVG